MLTDFIPLVYVFFDTYVFVLHADDRNDYT